MIDKIGDNFAWDNESEIGEISAHNKSPQNEIDNLKHFRNQQRCTIDVQEIETPQRSNNTGKQVVRHSSNISFRDCDLEAFPGFNFFICSTEHIKKV